MKLFQLLCLISVFFGCVFVMFKLVFIVGIKKLSIWVIGFAFFSFIVWNAEKFIFDLLR
jgi:hypothetical protein